MSHKHTHSLKLAMGIVIPVLIMAVTAVMIGMSFAWFSTDVDAKVDAIQLTTQEAFVLTFDTVGVQDSLPMDPYAGQMAVDQDGFIITRRKTGGNQQPTNKDQSSSDWTTYMLDAPFYFCREVRLSTGGKTVSLDINLQNITIAGADNQSGDVRVKYVPEATDSPTWTEYLNSDAPFAFTWFFKKVTTRPTQSGTESSTAINFNSYPCTYDVAKGTALDEIIETWYTPYGIMEFKTDPTSNDGVRLTTINGKAPTSQAFDNKSRIINFNTADDELADEDYARYYFYIIFAPEKLFWMQFFDSTKSITGVYATDEVKKALGEGMSGGMYYSKANYQHTIFSFDALVAVNVTE